MRKLIWVAGSVMGLLTVCAALAITMNEKIAREVFDEGLSKGRYELSSSLYVPGAAVHFEQEGRDAKVESAREEAREWRAIAPDLRLKIESLSERGDIVTIQWAGTGKNTGSGRGISASGKHFEIRGTTKFRFEKGKIAETWVNWDENELRRQIGAQPKERR